MVFLFKQEALEHFRQGTAITPENFYVFFPWDFGPFSSQVYDDLTFFMLRGFEESSDSAEESLPESEEEWAHWRSMSEEVYDQQDFEQYQEEILRLTEPKGVEFANALYDTLSGAQRRLLKEFKARMSSAPLRAILRYVYRNYPDMTPKSKIKEEVLGTR
jgi:hypothetical protein